MSDESTTDRPSKAEPACSWWQFSLRTMFVLVTLFVIALAWFVNGPERQRRASVMIREAGGMVLFDSVSMAAFDYRDDPGESSRWLPREYFESVKTVSVFRSNWTDRELALLIDLPGLERFWLEPDGFTDSVLGPPNDLTDRGFAHLATIASLKQVFIRRAKINDRHLAQLASLRHLEYVDLEQAEVTDAGVAHLLGNSNLEVLRLYGSNCTDAAIASLAVCPKLKRLRLEGKGITDAGLIHLRQLPLLENLELQETSITDEGLRHFCDPNLKALQYLELAGSSVSEAALEKLRVDRPSVHPKRLQFWTDGGTVP